MKQSAGGLPFKETVMSVRVHNISLEVDEPESGLREKAAQALELSGDAMTEVRVVRRAIDARRGHVRLVYSVDAELTDAAAEERALSAGGMPIKEVVADVPVAGNEEVRGRVVVVGCGPAGMFAGLMLAEAGYAPLLVERGGGVADRDARVKEFLAARRLDGESNFLFGAGGAGMYSDGKLRTRIRDPRTRGIIEELISAGAPEGIRIDARPHVGTDRLRGIIERLCAKLVESGGEIAWHTRLTGLQVERGALRGVEPTGGAIETNCAILATGANARDTFAMLLSAGVAMEAKPFQMGARIEHSREMIDHELYGKWAGHPRLGAAEYVLSAKGVTAFCVCPGGELVAACVEPETVCTNGMSDSTRSGAYTNGALVRTVGPKEFGSGPLDGLAYQKWWEGKAFELAGGDYSAPAQRAADFLSGVCHPVSSGTTYRLGVRAVNLEKVLPECVAESIAEALPEFERRIRGFAGEAATLVGPETRASCPVRIVRDKTRRVSASVDGLYPAGEGSGYSGGIMSSAVDGVKGAEAVIMRYAVPGKVIV